MPWLVVLGRGSWMRAGKRYEAGKHEVDELTAEAAKRAPVGNLRVLDEEPEIVRDLGDDGPLTAEHVRLGVSGGVVLVSDLQESLEDGVEEREKYDFSCRYCPLGFPSSGSLVRHVEMHHSI